MASLVHSCRADVGSLLSFLRIAQRDSSVLLGCILCWMAAVPARAMDFKAYSIEWWVDVSERICVVQVERTGRQKSNSSEPHLHCRVIRLLKGSKRNNVSFPVAERTLRYVSKGERLIVFFRN